MDSISSCFSECKAGCDAPRHCHLLPRQDLGRYLRYTGVRSMNEFLGDDFKPEYLEWVASKEGDDYYLKMMVAWYFATALAKQYDASVKVIERKELAPWTHNKAIQKACESFRVSDEHKTYLKTLKV